MPATPVTVIRHRKERIAKCSLRHLHERPGFRFLRASCGMRFDASGQILLAVDAPPLSSADRGRALVLLDSTWRHLAELRRCITGEPILRSIPGDVRTVYPRKSRIYDDPEAGLASVEALYVALRILGEDDESLLDGYHWKDQFLASLR
ncbi:MAG: hypothetical protein HZB39_17495 [Planctomycetes bacterium]|nr:hypothetical protein [Planctomycetota bacterium]